MVMQLTIFDETWAAIQEKIDAEQKMINDLEAENVQNRKDLAYEEKCLETADWQNIKDYENDIYYYRVDILRNDRIIAEGKNRIAKLRAQQAKMLQESQKSVLNQNQK